MGIVDRIDCYGPNIEAKKHMFVTSKFKFYALMRYLHVILRNLDFRL